jgi:hypothetical protein
MKKLLFLLLFAFALPIVNAQSGGTVFCWHTSPIIGPDGTTYCACRLHYGGGRCTCVSGKSCTSSGSCPSFCLGGATKEHLAKIHAAVSEAKDIVTVYTVQGCYDKSAKLWTDEAVKQGKAIRFVVSPEKMTLEQAVDWNKKLDEVDRAILTQER